MNSPKKFAAVDLLQIAQNFNNSTPLVWCVPAAKMTDTELLVFFAELGLGSIDPQCLVSMGDEHVENKPWKVEPFPENSFEAIGLLSGVRALAAIHPEQAINADLNDSREAGKPPRIITNIQFPKNACADIPEINEHFGAYPTLYIPAHFIKSNVPATIYSITDESSVNGQAPLLDILDRNNVPFDVRHANYDTGERWKRHLRFAPDGTRIDYTYRMSDNPHFDPGTLVDNIREVSEYWRIGIELEETSECNVRTLRQRA
jgi:hypothetical protein